MAQLQRMLVDGIQLDERAFLVVVASLRPADMHVPEVLEVLGVLRAALSIPEAAFGAFCERHGLPPPPREPAPDFDEQRRLARSRTKARIASSRSLSMRPGEMADAALEAAAGLQALAAPAIFVSTSPRPGASLASSALTSPALNAQPLPAAPPPTLSLSPAAPDPEPVPAPAAPA
eukprot:tig00000711_g3424.t1